jgi:hypothetical protein
MKLPSRPTQAELKAAFRVVALDIIHEELEAELEEESELEHHNKPVKNQKAALRRLLKDTDWVSELSTVCLEEEVISIIRSSLR